MVLNDLQVFDHELKHRRLGVFEILLSDIFHTSHYFQTDFKWKLCLWHELKSELFKALAKFVFQTVSQNLILLQNISLTIIYQSLIEQFNFRLMLFAFFLSFFEIMIKKVWHQLRVSSNNFYLILTTLIWIRFRFTLQLLMILKWRLIWSVIDL